MTGTRRALGGIAAVLIAAAAAAGCGIEPGSGACTETKISAPDVTLAGPKQPLSLTVTFTDRDGHPVDDAELAFFVRLEKTDGTGKTNGVRMGETNTKSGGQATFVRDDGVDGLGFSDERAIGYTVEYNPIVKVHNVQYCRSRQQAALTVR